MFFTFRELDFLGHLISLEKIGNGARFLQGFVQFFEDVFFHRVVIQDLFRLIIERKPTYFTFDFTFLRQVAIVFRPATAKFHDHVAVNLVRELSQKISQRELVLLNIGRKGYIFEVDLEYPPHLWETHNDYPLAPEKMIVNGVEKLICHFKPRKNYVVHYRNLRQYLEMGMRITAVHRGISFYQSSWMEPYIRKNTELRKTAANSFEKDFFKLMNNSVFGKTIENIRKRQNIELVDNRKRAVKLTSRPNFDRATIFDSHLIAVHMKKTEVYFNRPVYVGQAILDLSKTLMFDFHHNYIKNKYGNKAELLFTDTDSLM